MTNEASGLECSFCLKVVSVEETGTLVPDHNDPRGQYCSGSRQPGSPKRLVPIEPSQLIYSSQTAKL